MLVPGEKACSSPRFYKRTQDITVHTLSTKIPEALPAGSIAVMPLCRGLDVKGWRTHTMMSLSKFP